MLSMQQTPHLIGAELDLGDLRQVGGESAADDVEETVAKVQGFLATAFFIAGQKTPALLGWVVLEV